MKYFTIKELCKSNDADKLGIKNNPSIVEERALTALVDNILDPLREEWKKPIIVNSGFRCPKLNKAVGGVSTSQHVKGEAADIEAASRTKVDNKKLFDLIKSMNLPFDLLINEFDYSWIHVSFGPRRRHQILHAKKINGKTFYSTVP